MSNFFSKLLGGSAAPAKPAPAVVRRTSASRAPAPAANDRPLPDNVKVLRPTQRAPLSDVVQEVMSSVPASGIPVYKSVSDLLSYTEVSSLSGRQFALPGRAQEAMFVIKLAEGEDVYSVVTTKENFGSAVYKGTIQRITEAGGTVKACGIADGALINKVNREASEKSLESDQELSRIAMDIDKLAQAALDADASDIHIEKRAGGANVKLRINGRLEMYSDSWDPDYVMRLARALHTIADEDSKDTTFSPDGQMSVSRNLQPSGVRVKLRVQMSTAYPDEGLDIVIRVLRVAANAKVKSLETLGYAPEHIEMVEYMLSSPGGLTIIAGTTGSGKSTTLQTFMQNIRRADSGLKMISIEDPPEYVLEGVTQIPVVRRRNAKTTDNPFTLAMRSTMRMDPDVIMIGEIRDSESGQLTVSMVQSGHKALGTIHTESALGVIGRLRSMGVEADVLGARRFISGLIFQTLVPVLCPHCKDDYDPASPNIPAALHERIKHVVRPGDTLFTEHAGGCRHCNGRGIVGRTVCAEMVIPDQTILECIRTGDMTRAYNHWRGQRAGKGADSMAGATALDHGLLKMRRGEVSPQAIESALGLLHDFSQDTNITGAETGDLLGLGT